MIVIQTEKDRFFEAFRPVTFLLFFGPKLFSQLLRDSGGGIDYKNTNSWSHGSVFLRKNA